MSREVLGAAAEDREAGHLRSAVVTSLDAVPAPAPSVDALDDATDVTPEQRPPRRPNRLRRRPSRAEVKVWARRARVPLGVALAAGLVGALAGSTAVERRHTAEARAAVSVLGMLTWPEGGWERGQEELRLGLQVLNTGPEPVVVQSARLDDTASDLTLREGGTVDPGESARFMGSLWLDCETTRLTQPATLVLRVRTADDQLHEVTPEPIGGGLGMPTSELSQLCSWEGTTLSVMPGWVEPDGRLFVRLDNPGEEDVAVEVSTPDGTTVRALPELPLTVPAGTSGELRLALVVEACTGAATRPDAGTMLRIEDSARPGETWFEQSLVIGWMAQQVAMVCG